MELVEGGSLVRRLAQGPLGLREAAELVRTLARAADEAHRAGVVHRDLKPANILLAGDGTPKIGDFGLAKLLDNEPDGSNTPPLTETGTVLGTANYMAPEQVDGRSNEIGSATDVYALGAILYETLTGRPPFAAKTKLETLELVRSGSPVSPSQARPEVPFWLEAICLKCLEKRPERRYASAQALADDLDRWLRNERPEGTPGWRSRAGRAVRRHTAVLVAGIVIAALAVGASLRDPSRPLREIERGLARGKAQTLIGATGRPRWMDVRWGGAQSQSSLAHDGTFTITSFSQCMVELLPDPQSTRYRFTAQVRHDRGNSLSEVGLYVARKAHRGNGVPFDHFAQLSYNGVRLKSELLALVPGAMNHKRPPPANRVSLSPRLYSDEMRPAHVDTRLPRVDGPRFRPSGEQKNIWIDIEIIVTPERITARWNGAEFSGAVADLERRSRKALDDYPPKPGGPLPPDFRPRFDLRGGLGLYVNGGTASFRAVRVQPL
jgi:serine/threonine-protein kinase